MGVAHRHLDRGVPHELLDRLERHAAHREVRRERVPPRRSVSSQPAERSQARTTTSPVRAFDHQTPDLSAPVVAE